MLCCSFFLLECCSHLFVKHQYTNAECLEGNVSVWQRVPGPRTVNFFSIYLLAKAPTRPLVDSGMLETLAVLKLMLLEPSLLPIFQTAVPWQTTVSECRKIWLKLMRGSNMSLRCWVKFSGFGSREFVQNCWFVWFGSLWTTPMKFSSGLTWWSPPHTKLKVEHSGNVEVCTSSRKSS